MNMTEKLMREGGTIITYGGNGTSLTSFRCNPVRREYLTNGRSASAPRTIKPESVNDLKGNIFVDATHVPKAAYNAQFASAAAAIGSLRHGVESRPNTNYVQLIRENVGTQATGEVIAYRFEPID